MTLLTGGGAIMIALLMVGNAAAASANTTVSPAYKGLVAPENEIYADGCASHGKIVSKPTFHLKTGIGGGQATGKAGNCGKKLPKGFTFYSEAGADVGFEALIKLPSIPASTSNVSANLGGKYTVSASTSTGSHSFSCPSSISEIIVNDTEWEWNSFSSYAYNDTEYDNGVWYNYSYNTASIPSPFNFNSTTYYYSFSETYYYSTVECYSEVFGDTDMYADLCDVTTDICSSYSGTDASYFTEFEVEVTNYTDYSLTGDTETEWDQGTWYNYSSGAYNDNNTGSTIFNYQCSPCTSTSSHGLNTTQSYTSVTPLTGESFWFLGTFNPHDHYYVEFNFYYYVTALNENWVKGSSSFGLNAATLGNGIKLTSITMT